MLTDFDTAIASRSCFILVQLIHIWDARRDGASLVLRKTGFFFLPLNQMEISAATVLASRSLQTATVRPSLVDMKAVDKNV